jgi:hypothetical protein
MTSSDPLESPAPEQGMNQETAEYSKDRRFTRLTLDPLGANGCRPTGDAGAFAFLIRLFERNRCASKKIH